MAVLSTLATTTLSLAVSARQEVFTLASTSGITPGTRLWVDRELATVLVLGPVSGQVRVQRGVDGSAGSAHAGGATVTIGRADQFYSVDPVGAPLSEVLVSPWINVVSGVSFLPMGDETGANVGARYWQPIVTTNDIGALGVRTAVQTPAASA
jgi:hypothetical protein